MRVAIFGTGPSGLLAAHALYMAGYCNRLEIDLYAKNGKSRLYGCQYLHQPIPHVDCGEEVTVDYRMVGTPQGYYRKVYGNQRVGSVSPEEYGGQHSAWDIRRMYDVLWDFWENRIENGVVDKPSPEDINELVEMGSYTKIINTVPRHYWCINEKHQFKGAEIWAAGDAPELGIAAPFRPVQDNVVVCNGYPTVGWYRASRVFGHSTVEWPGAQKAPVSGVVKFNKPISTDCDCYADDVMFVGRFGEWKKGVLAHHVYQRVYDDAML